MNIMKNMVFNGKALISIVLITLLLSIVPALAVVYNVGVKEGDQARYDVSFTWLSRDLSKDVPPEAEFWELIDWFSLTVQSVSGKTITAQWLLHQNDGTEQSNTVRLDINTGIGNGTSLFSARDLSEGDEIPDLWEINETISRNYAGLTRDVNHLSGHRTAPGLSYDQHFYFDRATGIICEYSMTLSADYGTWTLSFIMIETNLWSPPPPPPFWTQWWLWTIIVVIVIVIASAVVILKRRKKPQPIVIAPPETKPVG